MIRQCCQCKKIEVSGHWVNPRLHELDGQDVSHGYCETCFGIVRRQMQEHHPDSSGFKRWMHRLF